MKCILLTTSILLASISGALADEFAIKLKPGQGSDLAQAQCSACHSVDYILMNSPFLDSKGWGAEVTKMISVFGADIGDSDAKTITDYLSQTYGK